ncbi:MAG: hypothetical protein PHC66_00550 [Candidatus Nanoarchaeia archaeon]|nr:hypothetical protein [Candidatus Nanoarchaeia archaeon]MDD5239564.1 hypothetical protein [Candidatus Nanoarchaeia archaeon]
MSKNLESLLKGIDLTNTDDVLNAFGIIDKKREYIDKRIEKFKKETEKRIEKFKKEAEHIEKIDKKIQEAAYKLTEITPLHNSKKMNSRAILYVLGNDNVVYTGELDLEKGKYLVQNESTPLHWEYIDSPKIIEELVKQHNKRLGGKTSFDIYSVRNPLNKLIAPELERYAAAQLLVKYLNENPGLKAKQDLQMQKYLENRFRLLNTPFNPFGDLFGIAGVELHVVEEGPMTKEKYKLCTKLCPKEEKCESYVAAKKQFGGKS